MAGKFIDNMTEEYYAIYQIAGNSKGREYRFMGLDYVTSHDMTVDAADYDFIYGGYLSEKETLDSLYEKFNLNHPAGYEGHSLSVSDVVVMQREGQAKAYYVDSFGFKELPDFVRQHLHDVKMNRKLNIDCKKAVEESIRSHFDGMHLDHNVVDDVLEEYGMERLSFVLACTVQYKENDGRFSRDTKEWAKGIPIPENMRGGIDLNHDYVVESHPAVLDGFIGLAREKFAEQEKNRKFLTAESVTNLKGKGYEYDAGAREDIYEFDCLVDGRPAVLTYTTGQREYFYSPLYERGEIEDVFSIHTDGEDIWNSMPQAELEKLGRVLEGEAEAFSIEERIEEAVFIRDLKEIDYGMMDMEKTAMTEVQRKRIWDGIDRKGTAILQEAIDNVGNEEELQNVRKLLIEAQGILYEEQYANLNEAIGKVDLKPEKTPEAPKSLLESTGRKQSVLEVIRERRTKLKAQEQKETEQKPQKRKKGEQEL